METVELILIKPNLSNNIGWVVELPKDEESFREIDRKNFVIPAGFTLESSMGSMEFYDENGQMCEINTNQKTKQPFLWGANGRAVFKPADPVFSGIKDLRRAVGFTQKQFADYFDVSIRTVQNWECGRANPADYLIKLMEYKLRNEGILRADVAANQE